MKKLISLLLALLLLLSLPVTAFAAQVGRVEYRRTGFFFGPGSLHYPTDLFPELKDVMPGDRLNQQVEIVHRGSRNVNIRIYIKAEGSSENADFIRQMQLQVEHKSGDILYDAPEYDATEKSGWIKLGTIAPGKKALLDLTLDVPADMGNEYADNLGTVVWKFKVEEIPIDTNLPKTGDYIMIAAAVMVLSAAALAVLLLLKKKKK